MKMKLSIVILNYNNYVYSIECVRSILNSGIDMPFEIILVDNDSDGHDYETLKRVFRNNRKIKIYKTWKNLGYSGGMNFGYSKSKGRYVILANNDIIVRKGWSNELIKHIEKDNKIAVVGSNVLSPKDDQKKYKNDSVNFLGYIILENVLDGNKIFAAGGCSLIIRRDLFTKPFDDDYFAYAEDLYLSWLARIRGYEVEFSPKSRVIHLGSKTSEKMGFMRFYYEQRNRLINILIFYDMQTILAILPMLSVLYIARNLYHLIKNDGMVKPRFEGYKWIIKNFGFINKKRKDIQKIRKVSDREIMKYMTCKVTNGDGKIINKISYVYCKIFGIKTHEICG